MNPLFLLAIAGGGYYFYDKAQKKKKVAASNAPKCDGTIVRHGLILLCDGTTCRGAIKDPAYIETDAEKQWGLGLIERHAAMVMGAKPWNPTKEQARSVLNHMMGEVFPECDWSLLAETAPVGESSIGEATAGLWLALKALGQQELPLPGEQTIKREGFELSVIGGMPRTLTRWAAQKAMWEQLFLNEYLQRRSLVTNDVQATNVWAEDILSGMMSGLFGEFQWPPLLKSEMTFYEYPGDNSIIASSWNQMVGYVRDAIASQNAKMQKNPRPYIQSAQQRALAPGYVYR